MSYNHYLPEQMAGVNLSAGSVNGQHHGMYPPSTSSHGKSVNIGPSSGVGMGPPSGMGLGPHSGMGLGPHSGIGMAPPSGMSMGPPGMGMGPPSGMPPGMGVRPPSGMGTRPPNGMGTGPPTRMGTGPPTGMSTGPPTGMSMGPPTGMGTGPPPGMGMGPPSGMSMGPSGSDVGIRQSRDIGVTNGMGSSQDANVSIGSGESRPSPGPDGMGLRPPGPHGGMVGPRLGGMGPGPGGMGPRPNMGMRPSMGPRPGTGPGSMGMRPNPGVSGMGPNSGVSGMGPGPGVSGMGPSPGVSGMGPRPGISGMGPSPGGHMSSPVQSQPVPQQKINPDMMPNPITLMKDNEEKYGGQVYHTSSSTNGVPPPLVSTQYIAQDNGCCSPRYMRSTMYTVPCTKDLVNQCKIPLGIVVQPLASVPMSENIINVVDHGALGPMRCNRCKAYMGPYCRFIDGGRRYSCPICQCINEVAPEYFSHLDHNGVRTDIASRPELLYGSVEYVATKDYCKESMLPNAPAYIFMIDVSIGNMQSGVVNLITQTMLSILSNLPKASSTVKVGFITYDRVLHFYNVKGCLTQPQMMVVSDVNDVFVPLVDGFLVDLEDSRQVIDNLMAQIPDMFSSNKTTDVVFEPLVRAGLESLKAAKRNGRLFIFHSNLPTASAPGQLSNRFDSKLLGTDKEKTLLSSAGGPYVKLAQDCVKHGVGVEVFLFPSTDYCDVSTIATLAQTTGGEVHLYSRLQTASDGERLIADVIKSVSRETGFDCVMRVRCSAGIRAVNYYGGFYMSNTTDIELGNIDSAKAIAIEIKHDDKMKEEDNAYIQVALLYTTIFGERRLRVHNMALKCSSKFTEIYQSCELDTIINFLCKSVITASQVMSYKTIRETLTTQCALILSCYRKHCSKQSPPGQLILPDSLKLLPLYACCLLKSDSLLSPPIVGIDEKCYQMHKLLTMNIKQSVRYLYPKLLNLEPVIMNESSDTVTMRCTGQKLSDTGLYLICNGLVNVIWVGQHVQGSVLSSIFGVTSHSQVDTNIHSLPALDNETSFKIRKIVKDLNDENNKQLKFLISKQRDKSEVIFRRLLKEDKGSGPWEGVSYIDYLCQLHKEIREILS